MEKKSYTVSEIKEALLIAQGTFNLLFIDESSTIVQRRVAFWQWDFPDSDYASCEGIYCTSNIYRENYKTYKNKYLKNFYLHKIL